jgi:hypothetical protein
VYRLEHERRRLGASQSNEAQVGRAQSSRCQYLGVAPQDDDEIALARDLLARWDQGRGTSKSQLEIETWGDATSHGRRFDRFVRTNLGVNTNRPSKQTDRIADLERQIRSLGAVPLGAVAAEWELQLSHARESCLAAIRVWNDPTARFRTGGFALMFVTAWNSLAIALLQRRGSEWRKIDRVTGEPVVVGGTEQALDTKDLIAAAFPADSAEVIGLRENVRFWIDLRNCVAHRHLPALDLSVIPQAQAGLMNFEGALEDEFGTEFTLAEALTVPLQLSGFRDPGVLASRKALQAKLPLDVQALLNRSDELPPEVVFNRAFQMRVAFIPVVPASGTNPDAVAYFVRPGEVPTELAGLLEQYVVLPKVMQGGARFRPTDVVEEVQERTGFRFDTNLHAEAARRLGVRAPRGDAARTCDIQYAEYVTSFKQYQYTQAWIDRLVEACSTETGFEQTTGKWPVRMAKKAE